MALITLDHVSKIYTKGTRPALDDVTVHIDRGSFVFLVGASGSGKTTLLSLLLHEEEATDGELHVAGNDLRRMSLRQVPQYRRSIGFIFQDYKLLNNKTVWQNVAFALEVIGSSRSAVKSLVPKVLETVGLTGKEKNYPRELSGGEAQRVAIARAYVNHPQILLADEPTGNLDPTTSLGIMEVLDAINRTGTTVVMATHNEEIVNSMRKRVVELHSGKVVRDQEHGSYDSALYFPDGEVESKAQQVLVGTHSAAERVATPMPDASDDGDHRTGEETQDAHIVRDGSEAAPQRQSGQRQSGASPLQAFDAVVQVMQDHTDEDDGIARLANSVHSGRTGRYGEAFQAAETTMTWGKGLGTPQVAGPETGKRSMPPAPPAEHGASGSRETPAVPSAAVASPSSEASAAEPSSPPAPPAPPEPSHAIQGADGAKRDEETPDDSTDGLTDDDGRARDGRTDGKNVDRHDRVGHDDENGRERR